MNLLDHIPRGRKQRASMEQIMFQANICSKNDFKKELQQVKKETIILFEDGYYIPEGNEVMEFIDKCNERKQEIQHLIELANKLMK